MCKQTIPNADVAPAGKPFVDTVPVAIRGREFTPLSPTVRNPEHRFDKAPTLQRLAEVDPAARMQKARKLTPFVIG